MSEKFAANPVTGTGSMTVPIATSPGRSGFGPQLALSYDSGGGNGPFGFGWNLSLPAITRKTDKGLPYYHDSEDSDVFILSGAEDLVPVFRKDANGNWARDDRGNLVIHEDPRTVDRVTYQVRRYRPRIEGLFARIERWRNPEKPEKTFWRSISKDNITTWYGRTPESRICDPNDKSRIFSWLICQSYDDKGNVIVYQYKKEDSENVDLSQANERNRTADTREANRYLKRICYGNREPYLPVLTATGWPQPPDQNPTSGPPNYYFEVVFDYEDGHYAESAPDAEGRVYAQPVYLPPTSAKWSTRVDPFSTYRAGFEVRTYRLCQRVLMFHHFPAELGVPDCLVRSTDFTYSYEDNPADARNPIYSFLNSVRQSGYLRQGNTYLKKSLPPVEFEYTEPVVQDVVEEVDPQSLDNLPIGLDGSAYRWTDLHGEGIPGILTEQAGAWYYKRNLSPIPVKLPEGREVVKAKFSALETVALKPNVALSGAAEFMDLAGDGQPDVVVMDGPTPGLFEHDDAESWQPFRTFTSRLNRDLRDPNLKFVDLDGDGHADVLITENDAFVWHASLAEEGFGPARRVAQALDEEKGPRIVFADGTQSVYLGDLSGDGLTDIVRIRNGEVCYWPNLGHGRFGAKVTMDNAPWFDHPDQFDHKLIRLADIDGSGTTDIIYLHCDGVRLYFNQSGNSWSRPNTLKVFPRIDDLVSIVPTDLLGDGTACLVWSSPLAGDARRPMRYVNLMGRRKPHLLVKTVNNLGAETRVDYAPSTKFYLEDKRDGKPWITRLPFPVHVVERVETYDHISRNRFVTRYAYHHGYFDGEEREFRGFGRVDQFDTEEFAALSGRGEFANDANIDQASHVSPVVTKTWFHTGIYIGRDHVSNYFAGIGKGDGEYYREPALRGDDALDPAAESLLLEDTILPDDLTIEEEREACRALKGAMLRQEVYALDKTDREEHPYIVTEQNFTIERLQPKGDNRHAVFFTHAREAITCHYERNPADPRVQHALTLEVDDYGNVIKQAAIGYGRRRRDTSLPTDDDRDKQSLVHITYTENAVTNAISTPADDYRTPLPAESRTYELRKPQQERSAIGSTRLYRFDDVLAYVGQAADGDHDVAYEDIVFGRAQQAVAANGAESDRYFRRLIEHVRTRYRPDDCGAARNDPLALLAMGTLESLALPGESYKLAFTPGLLDQVFQRPRPGQPDESLLSDPATVLGGTDRDQGGYVDLDNNGHWWIPSGRTFFSANPADPAATELLRAQQHFFLPRRYRDPFGQDAFVDFDTPHDMLMVETRDALGNRVTVDANDYRVLHPCLVSDPNRNQTEVAFDTLGMVAGTAVMGKTLPAPVEGDTLSGFVADLTQVQLDAFFGAADPHSGAPALLKDATTRIVYDFDAFSRSQQANPDDPTKWRPVCAATLARETHASATPPPHGLKIQINVSYSDGFGREIQKKIQAEPGPVVEGGPVLSQRWVGNGWTIFNNKGKPVRQYEPFFDDTHDFKFGHKVGVSTILFYDPVERVVAKLHPNHTYEKVVFDPWKQTSWDVNDTTKAPDNPGASPFDPKDDPDVGRYFGLLPDEEYLPTWHALRTHSAYANKAVEKWPDAKMRDAERDAAVKAVEHAKTPTTAHLDTLGRPFLTYAHNGFESNNVLTPILFATRVELDIESNQRAVIDAKDRIVMQYDYDMLGTRIHQISMEASERWMLNNIAGKPIRGWNSRRFDTENEYDALQRPTRVFVTGEWNETPNVRSRKLVEEIVYGDNRGGAEQKNLRGKVHQHFDTAGIVTNVEYDFKGNLSESSRQFLLNYKATPDWNRNPARENEIFTSQTRYDALNRPTSLTTPDGSIHHPTFNEANLLDKIDVNLRGAPVATPFVTNIDYNAKGQRVRIEYGNRAVTTYEYDEETFRLTNLKTTRPPGRNGMSSQLFEWPTVVQDLHYVYDPAGNITRIADDAVKTVFNGIQIDAIAQYTYDPIYRLIEATGREHIPQTEFTFTPNGGNYRDYPFWGNQANPQDPQSLQNYTEIYEYDAVGNFEKVIHQTNNLSAPRWIRSYAYGETSLIEDGRGGTPRMMSNRLSGTTINENGANRFTENYSYDEHGNMKMMSRLPVMEWDFQDQLLATAQQRVNNGTPETTWYVYDSSGQRVRKVTDNASNGGNTSKKEERIYLGGFEIYRKNGSNPLVRESLHIMDDKQRIALLETRTDIQASEQLIRYQFGNHLGSACLELDGQAQVISYEEYAPYGSSTYQAVRSQTEAAKRYRYTGKERDEESGLYYHGARSYAPWLGRWTSCDPIGIEDGPNLFAYTRGNPINKKDPLGTETKKVVRTDNYRDLLRESISEHLKKSIDEKTLTELEPRYLKSSEDSRNPSLFFSDPIKASFDLRSELFGRVTTKLTDFNPPGWEDAGGDPAACFNLACSGVNMTLKEGETPTGGGGVILYEAVAQRIKTDKTASDLALTQIKLHIDSGRSVLAGVNEPATNDVVDEVKQPVTDHFVAISGYETDTTGRITSLFAKDNAIGGTAEIKFIVNPDGSITKPVENRPGQNYINQEYQLSEVRFNSSLPYTGDLKPTNDANQIMYWPVKKDKNEK